MSSNTIKLQIHKNLLAVYNDTPVSFSLSCRDFIHFLALLIFQLFHFLRKNLIFRCICSYKKGFFLPCLFEMLSYAVIHFFNKRLSVLCGKNCTQSGEMTLSRTDIVPLHLGS